MKPFFLVSFSKDDLDLVDTWLLSKRFEEEIDHTQRDGHLSWLFVRSRAISSN